MSVLIKGVEMPMTCSDCEWSEYVGNGRAMCRRVSKTDKTDIMTKRRADFCPLIEVPPHGRLIDADELKTAFPACDNSMDIKIASVRATINHMPTVIEAEG